jgi:hypothetical protein
MTIPPGSKGLEITGKGLAGGTPQSRALNMLSELMRDIAACRAEIHRREALVEELERRFHGEVQPLEDQITAVRAGTFRALAALLQSPRLDNRSRRLLKQALQGLGAELEKSGIDLGDQGRKILREEAFADDEEFREDGEEEDSQEPSAEPRQAHTGEPAGGRARSNAAAKREAREQAVAGDIRALYLLLARALHPDKEADAARREEKTRWMQKVTTAYGDRDLARLLDILSSNPLDALGPYLSQAPALTVQGFIKRLRRELAILQGQTRTFSGRADPFLAQFLDAHGINEAAFKHYLAEVRKTLKARKAQRGHYATAEGLSDLIEALRDYDWRELM